MAPRPPVSIVLPHRERFGPLGAGAVGMVVHRLAGGPSRYDARVFGPRFAGPAYPGIPFIAVDSPAWVPATPTLRYALAVARALRHQSGPIEVYNKPDVAMVLARLFPSRPVALFLHNDPRTMRGARTPAARARALRRLARVATVSDYVGHCMIEGVSRPVRAPETLRNAICLDAVPPAAPPHARERLILFAGRVVPEKGPDAFVAACALALPRLPGWRAEVIGADGFVAGAADTPFIRDLRRAADGAGVAMHGYRPHDAVMLAMARAAIVVVPSRWQEPFGLSALEAMACGAAVACSGRGGLAEVVGDAAAPIDPDDPSAMAATLVTLATDEAWRAELCERALHRVRTAFSNDDAVAQLDRMRDRLAAR